MKNLVFIDNRSQKDIEMGTEIAFFGASDASRIEKNAAIITRAAIAMGYDISEYIPKAWADTDEFTESKVRRFISQISDLASKTGISENIFFQSKLHFDTVNTWERALRHVSERLDKIRGQWRYSGEVVSGDEGGIL